jgi:hypothetical protein
MNKALYVCWKLKIPWFWRTRPNQSLNICKNSYNTSWQNQLKYYKVINRRDSSADDRGFEWRQGLGIFLFTMTVSRPALGPTQPPIQGTRSLSLGVKRPGREADHSPPFSALFRNAWSYTSTPQYAFMAWCSVKTQGLYFTLLYFTLLYFYYKIICIRCSIFWVSQHFEMVKITDVSKEFRQWRRKETSSSETFFFYFYHKVRYPPLFPTKMTINKDFCEKFQFCELICGYMSYRLIFQTTKQWF